jgi:hypothetical protein
MDATTLFSAVLSTQSPLLPLPGVERHYLALGWGLVLAAGASWLLQRRGGPGPRLKAWLPLLLLLWCLWPGPASPAYWLGLAFRAPSLVLTLLCGWALACHYRPQALPAVPLAELRRWAWVPVLLGWVLLLDTLALSPFSFYSLGFAPLTLGLLVLAGLLPWLLRGAGALSGLLVAALGLYVLLRLPSGNVWDVLLDPWLWLALQADGLRRTLRRA